jgi:hypothetical protein
VASLTTLAEDLHEAFAGEYSSIATDDEFASQHRLPETGLNPHGIALEQHIPGVYFANFFGQALGEFIGVDALERCPAVVNKPLATGGWLITTADSPIHSSEADALALKRQVREALGERHFFDILHPNAITTAPMYDFSQVRIGQRPLNVQAQSIAEAYFASEAATQGFVEERRLWCERLKRRLPPANLDFSARSLVVLDNHLSAIVSGRTSTPSQALVLEVAAYYGAVLERTFDATWEIDATDSRMPAVRLPSGDVEYPLVRAIKLVEDGDRLSDWFEFVAKGGQSLLG